VDRQTATFVSDPAQANLTIAVTRREIVFGTNTVHARLTVGGFSAHFTGRSDGMWGPAATDLAKQIDVWLSANVAELRTQHSGKRPVDGGPTHRPRPVGGTKPGAWDGPPARDTGSLENDSGAQTGDTYAHRPHRRLDSAG
jgi:hypothetical protein